MNDKAQMLLAAFLKLYSHVSRIRLYRLRHCVIKNGVDDAGDMSCERKTMLLGETIDTCAQNTVFCDDFSNIKSYSPSLHAVLCRTHDDTGFSSFGSQVLSQLCEELRNMV